MLPWMTGRTSMLPWMTGRTSMLPWMTGKTSILLRMSSRNPPAFAKPPLWRCETFSAGGGERGGERLRRRAALALAPLVDATLDGEA